MTNSELRSKQSLAIINNILTLGCKINGDPYSMNRGAAEALDDRQNFTKYTSLQDNPQKLISEESHLFGTKDYTTIA